MTISKTHKTLALNIFQSFFELIESKLQDDIKQFSIFLKIKATINKMEIGVKSRFTIDHVKIFCLSK